MEGEPVQRGQEPVERLRQAADAAGHAPARSCQHPGIQLLFVLALLREDEQGLAQEKAFGDELVSCRRNDTAAGGQRTGEAVPLRREDPELRVRESVERRDHVFTERLAGIDKDEVTSGRSLAGNLRPDQRSDIPVVE